jgi:hypothetical protein
MWRTKLVRWKQAEQKYKDLYRGINESQKVTNLGLHWYNENGDILANSH